MRRLFTLLLVAALSVFIFLGPAQADTLETRGGKMISGEYLGGSSATVRFLVQGLVKVYDLDKVSVLVFERGDKVGARAAVGAPVADSSGISTQTLQPAAQPRSQPGVGAGVGAGTGTPRLYEDTTGQSGGVGAVSRGSTGSGNVVPTITIPPGLVLKARLSQALSTARNGVGDRFLALLDNQVSVLGITVVPRGAKVFGRVVSVRRASRRAGGAEMTLELTDLNLGQQPTSIITDRLGMNTDAEGRLRITGQSGMAGGSVTVTPGKQIMINSGAIIEFILRQPLVFQAR